MKMAEGCCSGASFLLIFGLLVTQRWLGSSVFAIPEKRDDDALRREYPLEEFLWTGSGDGPEHEGGVSWLTTTVFRTTTRLLAPPASASLQLSQPSASCPLPASCSLLVPSPTWPTDDSPTTPVFTLEPSERSIVPSMSSKFVAATPSLATPTVTHSSWPVLPSDRPPDRQGDSAVPEQRFWIVTVVEEEDQRRAPDTSLLEVGLARLYATAFKRQQERHLGIINATNGARVTKLSGVMSRRRRVPTDVEPLTNVHVRVHNVSEGEPRRVQLVYSVHVRGRPVLARAAVHDMRLVSDAEVAHELGGLSIVTKAEPYLKEKEQITSWTPFSTSPWVLAGGAISVVALLALVLILLLLATTRHKRARRIAGREQEGRAGTTNASFEPDEPRVSSDRGSVSAASDTKMLPSEEGDWGVDSDSLGDEIPPPSAGQAEAAIAAAVAAARSRSVSSPSSYLSMPSVRRFPRGGNIPEPLSHVLQQGGDVRGCLSMRNLDLYPDETAFEPPSVSTPPPPVPRSPWGARHGSLDGEDPGVIGPCVYQMARGAGPARRRFHELLDDAFSLFGGRSDEDRSPTPPPRPPSPRILDSRVHSAAQARVSEPESPPLRPKTSEPRRAAMQHPRRSQAPDTAGRVSSAAGPRGAWETPGEGSNVRPLSAGPFHRPRLPEASKPPPYRVTPRISTERILCDAELPPTDPAVPLINAIKDELQRLQSCSSCSTTPLPGSCPPSAQSKK